MSYTPSVLSTGTDNTESRSYWKIVIETPCELAKENRLRTIAFPSISTGVYGYPIEEAARIAIRTIDTFLKENPEIQQVTMCCFSGYDKSVYTKALEQITTHEP